MNSIPRIGFWKDTVSRCDATDSLREPAKSVLYNTLPGLYSPRVFDNTRVLVLNKDCLECAQRLHRLKPAVLNLADDNFPGGAVEMGSAAQEESIFRRTNIHRTLNLQTGFYPLRNIDTVYSPSVKIFKNRDGTLRTTMTDVAIITAPALRMPALVDGSLSEKDANILKHKIRMVLEVALYNKHTNIILGAMGCGAWKNPPGDVARCFQEVLREYKKYFQTIIFAILKVSQSDYLVRDRRALACNYTVFKSIIESSE